MENSEPEIIMWRANGRRGATILKKDYEAVSAFIFSLLQEKETIEIQQLVEEAKSTLPSVLGRDYCWCLLRVKHDLEAKGLIRVTVQPDRTQFIKATRKGLSTGVSVL
jgi:hypothetical protein